MAFERLLRLTKKCPGYVVSGLRNTSVGIARVTQKSFESQYYITRALFGTWSLFAMTVPNLTARPLFSPVYLNRRCANSANSSILIIKMLEMIGIMQKSHLYHRLVEKYEYLFYNFFNKIFY